MPIYDAVLQAMMDADKYFSGTALRAGAKLL